MVPAIENQADSLRSLCLNYGVQRLEVFGSAATSSKLHVIGDLDFLVEFQPKAFVAYADTYFGLLEDLQQLFGRPVDLGRWLRRQESLLLAIDRADKDSCL